jgi:hypothetical protein
VSLQPPNFEVQTPIPSAEFHASAFGRVHGSRQGAGLRLAELIGARCAWQRPRAWNFQASCSFSQHTYWREAMDKDRIKGSAEQAKGKVKDIAGKVTGD